MGGTMEKIHEYLKSLYLKCGVSFFLEDGELKTNYDDETEKDVNDSILALKNGNYDLFLRILATLIVCNYIHLLDFYEELTEDEDDDESLDNPDFDDTETWESNDDEEYVSFMEFTELLEKVLEYIKNAQDIHDLVKATSENGDLEDFLELLLDFHLNLTFENTYPQICSMVIADNDQIAIYRKFLSADTINQIFMVGFDYLVKKKPDELLYTIESFYLFSKDIDGSYAFHAHLVDELLKNGLLDNLTVYISEILWDTYTSYKEQEANDNLSSEAREYMANYETDLAFRERECRNLIFNPYESNVLRLYLEFNELEPYPEIADIEDIETLVKKRNEEIADFIRKLVKPK